MSRHFSVVEPHPSVPKTGGYVGGGRGGAGNFTRVNARDISNPSNASGPASLVPLSKSGRRTVPAGRGGAGNMFRPDAEEPMFQFDEEMLKARQGPSAPVYKIGRGGAGNIVDERRPSGSRFGSTSSAASTASADTSASSGVLGRISRQFKRPSV